MFNDKLEKNDPEMQRQKGDIKRGKKKLRVLCSSPKEGRVLGKKKMVINV